MSLTEPGKAPCTTALHWFRNDLRAADNEGLTAACKADRVLAVYCFDPRSWAEGDFGFPKMGPFRARFLWQTVASLREELQHLGIPLFVFVGYPEVVIPTLAARHQVNSIHIQREWTRDECEVRQAVEQALPPDIAFHEYYDQFLYHPDEIPYGDFERIPEVFTDFRKRLEARARVRPPIAKPMPRENGLYAIGIPPMPAYSELGIPAPEADPRSAFPFRGGSHEGWQRLQAYIWDTHRLRIYKKTRNGLIGSEYSSKFSPWLANGSLSARQIYSEVKRYEQEVVANRDTYWMVFELIWRDYFKYISLKHGNRIFGLSGIRGRRLRWKDEAEALQAWTEGQTGNDFVDANMRELAATGWMSNRGRQNVASYWAKELRQDWRLGAAWFEYLLLDYDVHSNWGNWMYNSGVGNDRRDRKFNPSLQAQRYDPSGKFRRMWLQPTLFESDPVF